MGLIMTREFRQPRPALAIGRFVLDLQTFAAMGGFSELNNFEGRMFVCESLRPYNERSERTKNLVRRYLRDVLTRSPTDRYRKILRDNKALREQVLLRRSQVFWNGGGASARTARTARKARRERTKNMKNMKNTENTKEITLLPKNDKKDATAGS